MNLKNLEVVTFFSPYQELNQAKIYEAIAESFKSVGNVIVTKEESLFQTVLRLPKSHPVCFLAMTNLKDRMEISLQVISEAQTSHSIWKKETCIGQIQDSSQIIDALNGLIKAFGTDYSKANPNQKDVSFYVREFKHL